MADQQNQAIAKGRVLVHVIADQATVDGRDDQPAFMDGHGVISAAHLRDLLARDDVRVRPLNQTGGNARATDHNSSSGGSDDGQSAAAGVAAHPPAPDPYRPSAALDTFIRARDGYCTIPGCDQPGWKCDIDHVQEYDHDNPGEGGHTSPDELGAKCRMHHNFKTFAHGWVDDQYRDNNGRLVSEVVSPEGIRFPGPAETNADLFPSLDHITWHEPRPISIQLLLRRSHSISESRGCAIGPRTSTADDEPNAPPTANNDSPRNGSTPNRNTTDAANTPAKPTAPRPSDGKTDQPVGLDLVPVVTHIAVLTSLADSSGQTVSLASFQRPSTKTMPASALAGGFSPIFSWTFTVAFAARPE